MEPEGCESHRAFFTWVTRQRPFVILKWAQSSDRFLGTPGQRTPISGPGALRLVHRWRSESDAILVGNATALADNPRLNTRLYGGKNPLRIVFDRQGKLPRDCNLLDDSTDTWVYGPLREGRFEKTLFLQTESAVPIPALLSDLKAANRASLLVEGGARVLSQFIEHDCWDEIRMIENERRLGSGLPAPLIPVEAQLKERFRVGADTVSLYTP
jgi:diaminohydroxyphosphoribosylaminopyrimidine deaminase/5-amino-6-(5-phosphoribosylamino)uracil reductase